MPAVTTVLLWITILHSRLAFAQEYLYICGAEEEGDIRSQRVILKEEVWEGGGVEMCTGQRWWTVCNLNRTTAALVCNQLGMSALGDGFYNIPYSWTYNGYALCVSTYCEAGATELSQCTTSTCTRDTVNEVHCQVPPEVSPDPKVNVTLGTVVAFMGVVLVGVVLRWVWTCYKRSRISSSQEQRLMPIVISDNPAYAQTVATGQHRFPMAISVPPPPTSATPTYDFIRETHPQGEKVYDYVQEIQLREVVKEEGDDHVLETSLTTTVEDEIGV